MISHIAHVNVWVDDQDVAKEFYTQKLGMEVRSDVTLDDMGFRWLTVGVPGQADVAFVLMAIPGPPVFETETAKSLADLVSKGATGAYFLATDDCQASYEELKSRGVEFSLEPTKMPYGIDASFRDPAGNAFRLTQAQEI